MKEPIIYSFNVEKIFKKVRHYKCQKVLNESNLLTTSIHLSKDKIYNESKNVVYWLKLRELNKWEKEITGLKRTNNPLLYYSDIPILQNKKNTPTHLLVFKFNKEGTKLIIYLYQNHYSKSDKKLEKILSNHY